jgi:deoxyribonuclease (pyrimidine dimer)
MARINVGVNPKYLSDQHLLAEAVEILMVVGTLKKQKYILKKPIPNKFTLGAGHIRFFWDKILFLDRRLNQIKCELQARQMQSNHKINLSEVPSNLLNDWNPQENDFLIIKERIADRLTSPLKGKSNFHKYCGTPINNMVEFVGTLNNSKILK